MDFINVSCILYRRDSSFTEKAAVLQLVPAALVLEKIVTPHLKSVFGQCSITHLFYIPSKVTLAVVRRAINCT